MSEIDRRWIVACLIAAVATVAAGFLDFVARGWLEAGRAETPFDVTLIYAAVSTVLVAGSFAVYAWFTGPVLRQIAPALQLRQWMALHLAIGVVVGFGLALTYTAPTGEPDDWRDAGFLDWTLAILLFVSGCVLLGAVYGSLEALILRRAAEGLRRWIVISALAMAAAGLLMFPSVLFYPTDGTFVREAADQGVNFVAFVAAAFLMLPALRRLRPRQGGAPR